MVIKKHDKIANWRLTFNKPSSAKIYVSALRRFCSEIHLTPNELAQKPLNEIEDLTETFIHRNKTTLAPKYLNLIYCSVKSWCLYTRKIKNTAQFRQIRFDKSSRKTRDRMMLTKAIAKNLFDNADLEEKIVIAFYGINGLRPSLIPQILIEDVYSQDIKLNDDSVELAEKTWIWVKREYKGNKGNIDFPIITTAEESAWLEEYLNTRIRKGEKLTPKSQIVLVKDKNGVDYIVKKLFEAVGFEGRNYLLRHYAFKQLKRTCEDYDLREWLMGHKGKISPLNRNVSIHVSLVCVISLIHSCFLAPHFGHDLRYSGYLKPHSPQVVSTSISMNRVSSSVLSSLLI